jgi:hypothetical protein
MSIDVVIIDEQPRVEFGHENIQGFLLPEVRHASASVGIIPPHRSQRHHRQRRPDDGIENVFIFRGTFAIEPPHRGLERHDCARQGPVFVQVPSGSAFSIRNVGDEPVWFYTVFSPPFQPGEIEFIAPASGSGAHTGSP